MVVFAVSLISPLVIPHSFNVYFSSDIIRFEENKMLNLKTSRPMLCEALVCLFWLLCFEFRTGLLHVME